VSNFVPFDPKRNLLHELFPDGAPNKDRPVAFELIGILEEHFHSSRWAHGSNAVYFPSQGPVALRIDFTKKWHLSGMEALPALTDQDWEAIRKSVQTEIFSPGTTSIGREIMFSLKPVQGCWRYRDLFQIMPAPANAPRAPFRFAEHPFVMEFAYRRSNDLRANMTRRSRPIWELHCVLNALLRTRISWSGGKSVGHHDHSWVYITQEYGEPRSAYLQHFYWIPWFEGESTNFAVMHDVPQLETVPQTTYYAEAWGVAGDNLALPADLELSFDAFYNADPEKRRRLLRAAYWLDRGTDLKSFSLSTICLVQAIDALVPTEKLEAQKCPCCGLERRPSRTELFTRFLDRVVPASVLAEDDRKALFKVRSDLSHGFRDPFHADQWTGIGLHPEGAEERRLGENAWRAARYAFHSFLHSNGTPGEFSETPNAQHPVPGSVIDVVTGTSLKNEEPTEFRLVEGQLTEPGKTPKWPDLSEPRSKRARRGPDKQDRTTYKAATIKSVVLEVDGKEVAVVTGNRMKFVDADGKQLKGKGLSKQVLKEGAKVDVTTSKSDDGTETIREIRQVHGSEDDK
jgi:hypothetical protein